MAAVGEGKLSEALPLRLMLLFLPDYVQHKGQSFWLRWGRPADALL